ncbi:hypothetical protein B0I37DRAFT_382433 [Chaetomium sp. MPI-CAGE-AT-0009]|nr:hypothetical protein B0I37DRAFT_382433 [Chaetomium sp. MPI-CAGE-AT-0009]
MRMAASRAMMRAGGRAVGIASVLIVRCMRGRSAAIPGRSCSSERSGGCMRRRGLWTRCTGSVLGVGSGCATGSTRAARLV